MYMKHLNFARGNVWTAILTLAGFGILATGCVERQVEYVPVYRVQPVYAGQPAYLPPPPPPAGAPAAPTADWQQPPPAPAPVPAQAAPPPKQAVVVAPSAPPAPQVEVIPVAPGPYYAWAPGYWSWNGRWIWIGGHYISRPRPNAVYVGGHWGRHGHGYVWVGGGWR
jgi:hypothetical protein